MPNWNGRIQGGRGRHVAQLWPLRLLRQRSEIDRSFRKGAKLSLLRLSRGGMVGTRWNGGMNQAHTTYVHAIFPYGPSTI